MSHSRLLQKAAAASQRPTFRLHVNRCPQQVPPTPARLGWVQRPRKEQSLPVLHPRSRAPCATSPGSASTSISTTSTSSREPETTSTPPGPPAANEQPADDSPPSSSDESDHWDADTSPTETFAELAEAAGVDVFQIEARPSVLQRGLFTTSACSRDSVLLRVPLEACLQVNYANGGLSVCDAPWPRLRAAVAAPEPLPWDILFSTALLDALASAADPLLNAYAPALLPHPSALTVPFCQPPEALAQLQHGQVAEAAQAQQARLAAAFPEFAVPASVVFADAEGSNDLRQEGNATLFQWALACVRSRAFHIGKDHFAFVPFLDVANHSTTPNATFRLAADSPTVELFATQDLPEGSEVTVSYTGPSGATNRRLLVQYGFVLERNPADRLDLGLEEGYIGTSPQRGPPGAALSLSRLQAEMGDERFNEMLAGRALPLLCALKSLPTYDMVAEELPNPAQVLADEAGAAAELRSRLSDVQVEFDTTIEEDEEALGRVDGRLSAWERTAITYRLQRKQLARAAGALLDTYDSIAARGS